MDAPKILIADDSPVAVRMLETMLQGAGFELISARDGIEAIEKVFANDVSLVVLDVMMPRMNGYQVCRLLKSEPSTRHIPVVILTSKNQAGDRFWGLETGAEFYLTKDQAPQKILEIVAQALSEEAVRKRRAQAPPRRTSVDILASVNDMLDRKLYETTILSEIGRVARVLSSFDETFLSVMGLVARLVDYAVGGLAFVDVEHVDLVLTTNRQVPSEALEWTRAQMLKAIAAHGKEHATGECRHRVLLPKEPQTDRSVENKVEHFHALPIVSNEHLVGLLGLAGRNLARLTNDNDQLLVQVANLGHIVVENSRLIERLREMSVRDGLTQLYNHRHAMHILATEFSRVGRYQEALSVLMIDIDHFKRVNDEHGHQVGDLVLREVGALLNQHLRNVDSVGRYGGEEFIIILPHTPCDAARQTAERLRSAVEQMRVTAGGAQPRLTISIGVACHPSVGVDSPNALIRAADEALYEAKAIGRNRVV
jgi:two-component system, cell cycle response regulator